VRVPRAVSLCWPRRLRCDEKESKSLMSRSQTAEMRNVVRFSATGEEGRPRMARNRDEGQVIVTTTT
jgi:hypothetical protein